MPSLNWTCDNCGRTFSRVDTASRHVERVHNGNGEVVRFSDYVAGIKVGIYKPNSTPRSGENEDKIKKTFTNAFYDEIGRQAAQSFYATYLATKRLSVTYESLVAIQELIFDDELITPGLKSALRASFIQEYDAALQAKIKQLKKEIDTK